MKKIYSNLSRFTSAAALLGALLTIPTSCVDDTYSLDKEIDTDMSLGGTITLPLGSSAPITLSDMLDTDDVDMLEELADGSYLVSMSDAIDVDLSELSDIEVNIDQITEVVYVDPVTIDIPTPDSFSITPESPTVIDVTIDQMDVDKGSATPTTKSITVAPDLPSGISGGDSGYPLTDEQLTLTLVDSDEPMSFEVEFECPDQVDQITNIKFASTASITLDATNLKTRFGSDFSMILPYVTLKFPAGFEVDGTNSNVVSRTNVPADASGVILINYTIDNYTTPLTNTGAPIKIGGEIEYDIARYIVVSGTTSGITPSSDNLTLDIYSQVSVDDLSMVVAGIEAPINATDNLGDAIEITLDNMITGIKSATLLEGSNFVNINITPLAGLPSQLSAASGDYITITFPHEKYLLGSHRDLTVDASSGDYLLQIPVTDVVGGTGYDEDIEIEVIYFAEEDFHAGTDEKSAYVEFDPEISVSEATVRVGGSVDLSEYELFAVGDHQITASFSADNLVIETADLESAGYSVNLKDMESVISESVSVPSAIDRIYSLTFANDPNLSIGISVEIEGTDADLSFDNYQIVIPGFIQFAEGVPAVWDEATGTQTITLTDTFITTGSYRSYKTSYPIVGFDFSDESYDNSIVEDDEDGKVLLLNETIQLSGSLSLAGGEVDSGSLSKSVTPDITYYLTDMVVDKVYGVLNPDVPTTPTEVDLSELADLLSGDELSLVLSDPSISFVATNTLDIPIQIDYITLTPTKGGELIQTEDLSGQTITTEVTTAAPIIIDAAVDGEPTVTTIYVVSEGEVPSSTGDAKYVEMANLKYMLSSLPDLITLSYEASSANVEGQVHMVDLSRTDPYTFSIDYDLNVPLRFDALSLDYTTEVTGMAGDMEDILDYISELEIALSVENTMPINLQLSQVVPIDQDGNEITTLDSPLSGSQNTIVASGVSNLALTIADNEAGDLKLLDGFKIYLDATIDYTEGGAELNGNQYLIITMSATLPGGINISFDEEE